MFSFKILRNWCVCGGRSRVFSREQFILDTFVNKRGLLFLDAPCTRCSMHTAPVVLTTLFPLCRQQTPPPPLPGAEVKRCPGGKMGKPRANILSPAKRCTDSVNIVLFTLPFTSLPLFDNGCSRGKATCGVWTLAL